VPGAELARTLRLVRERKYDPGLPRVSHLSPDDRLAAEEANIRSCLEWGKTMTKD
jgi:hypothetical protein